MVLYVGLDYSEQRVIDEIIKRLTEFFENKSYKIGIINNFDDLFLSEIMNNYPLKTHEVLLLNAISRSIAYYDNNWEEFDLCFINNTYLSDYQYSEQYIPDNFIKQVNRFYPKLDLYITISDEEKYETIKYGKFNHHRIKYDDETVVEDIIKLMFDNLPRCNWCGRLFTKSQKNKKYCSPNCKKYALEEQYRINNRNYYHKYKDVMSERSKGQLGSRGANLHGRADLNPVREMEKVRNAKRALGLRPIQ